MSRVSIPAAVLVVLLFGAVPGLAKAVSRGRDIDDGVRRPDLIIVLTPTLRPAKPFDRFPAGSKLVRYNAMSPGSVVALTPEFFAAADPEVSFDGKKVLFSGQEAPGGHWQIWEMSVDGTDKRRLTSCEDACLQAAYLGDGSEFVYTEFTARLGQETSHLAVAKLDGSNAHSITFGPGNFRLEKVLRDGRILASASWPLVPDNTGSRVLYTLRPDGTGIESFRFNSNAQEKVSDAEELDDGAVVFVTRTDDEDKGGKLAIIRRGAMHSSPLNSSQDLWLSPRRVAPDRLFASRWIEGSREVAGKFDIYELDPARGEFGKEIFKDRRLSSIQAVPIMSHLPPKTLWSTLKPQERTGSFISLNAYQCSTAHGERLPTPISRVRVTVLKAPMNTVETLGEVPVEQDGSFYLAVPVDQPLRFALLDQSGKTIMEQSSWIWVRPGEEHGCVGCHEDKAVAPSNRWPLTLKRLDTPMRLGVQQ